MAVEVEAAAALENYSRLNSGSHFEVIFVVLRRRLLLPQHLWYHLALAVRLSSCRFVYESHLRFFLVCYCSVLAFRSFFSAAVCCVRKLSSLGIKSFSFCSIVRNTFFSLSTCGFVGWDAAVNFLYEYFNVLAISLKKTWCNSGFLKFVSIIKMQFYKINAICS